MMLARLLKRIRTKIRLLMRDRRRRSYAAQARRIAGVVMLVALFSVLACVFRNLQPPDRTAVLLWFACACSIIVLQGAGHLSRKIHGYVPLRADRYFLVPYVIFCFTLVRLFARSSGRAMRSFSVCVTVVALTATTIPRFSIPEKPDVGWRGRMKSYRTRGHATFIDNSQREDGRWEFELDSCRGGPGR